MVFLETSSYLPLIWTTPYSQSVVSLMREYESQHDFALQRDCVFEAAGYLAFEDNWRYHPAVRIKRLLEKCSDPELGRLGHPSTAIQLLLGGNIWPQAQYLNYVRHTTFFLADLLDGLTWKTPRAALATFVERIEERVKAFRHMLQEHATASTLRLPSKDILPYWGKWYLPAQVQPFEIHMIDDPRPYNMTADNLRDIYHYDCAVNHNPRPRLMVVANTGFVRNVKASFTELRLPVVCAETTSVRFFS